MKLPRIIELDRRRSWGCDNQLELSFIRFVSVLNAGCWFALHTRTLASDAFYGVRETMMIMRGMDDVVGRRDSNQCHCIRRPAPVTSLPTDVACAHVCDVVNQL
jgi:hypothetical protein